MSGIRAVVDCGSNSTRLWLRVHPGDHPLRREQVTRLGQGVDASGRLHPDAVARTLEVLAMHARRWRDVGVTADEVVVIATSAVRDAANRDEFRASVVDVTGVAPQVLSGRQEAIASFVGATTGLAQCDAATRPTLVVDIGGGSTEFVVGTPPRLGDLQAVSLQLGTVRLTERALPSDPPLPTEIVAARRIAAAEIVPGLHQVGADAHGALHVRAVAGTATTLAALDLGDDVIDNEGIEAVDGHVLTPDALAAQVVELAGRSVSERMQLGPLAPGRADVIAAGAIILDEIVGHLGRCGVTVSVPDVMDGVATLGPDGLAAVT